MGRDGTGQEARREQRPSDKNAHPEIAITNKYSVDERRTHLELKPPSWLCLYPRRSYSWELYDCRVNQGGQVVQYAQVVSFRKIRLRTLRNCIGAASKFKQQKTNTSRRHSRYSRGNATYCCMRGQSGRLQRPGRYEDLARNNTKKLRLPSFVHV